MSATDYSGIDVSAGEKWRTAGWSLLGAGMLLAAAGAGVILVHVVVVLLYARSLGVGEP